MIDVAIDPFPYGGATTTCESLYMGVPVITLNGNRMVNNLSASILHNANLKHLIASNKEEYIQIGRSLCESGKRSIDDRQKLKNSVVKSKFGNSKRLVSELERIYKRELDI